MAIDNTYNTTQSSYTNNSHKVLKLSQDHEKGIIVEKNKHELACKDKDNSHEINKMKISLGWLGVFFGGKELTALNISGALLILLILFGVGLSIATACMQNVSIEIKDIWTVITPIITLTLGYIFGSKNN